MPSWTEVTGTKPLLSRDDRREAGEVAIQFAHGDPVMVDIRVMRQYRALRDAAWTACRVLERSNDPEALNAYVGIINLIGRP